MSSARLDRVHEIQRIRADLERYGFPRIQMCVLVGLTGAAGFVASYLFLRAGLSEMWLRYLVSFGVAYLVFLVLLWLWLRTRAGDYSDLSNLVPSPSDSPASGYQGHGGEFGGGGASGSFDAPGVDVQGCSTSGSVGDALASASDAEEFAIPLIVLVLLGALLLSSLFVVYSAPILFAELIVDGVLSASLYRKLRGLETRHWLETAIRRTVWPFALTAAFVSAIGWAMAIYAPEAHSIGEVVVHAKQQR
jgi:hypothetical protein